MKFDQVEWRELDHLKSFLKVSEFSGEEILHVDSVVLKEMAKEAFHDISHFLRSQHLEQLKSILADPEASKNDRFVALDLLRNSQIAAEGILPMCQDTGTAIIMAKKGRGVWTAGNDEAALSKGIEKTYATDNLRFSQLAPLTMFEEKNTRSNLVENPLLPPRVGVRSHHELSNLVITPQGEGEGQGDSPAHTADVLGAEGGVKEGCIHQQDD